MNEHLTDQELIDYQFKLASEAGMNEAGAHLETCDQCRRRLAELTRKFAALDLLREEIAVSESLLSKTVENAATARRRKIIPFYRLPWLGAVAAAVIVGFALLLTSQSGRKHEAVPSTASDLTTGQDRPASLHKGMAPEPERLVAAGRTLDKGKSAGAKGLVRSVPVRAYEETPYGVSVNALNDTIEEKPPFAPASAIELVVLPRRQDVQLTIYNAADLTLVRERRNLTLKRGWNWLQFMWANTLIDPTSLSLEPLEHKDRVEVQQLVFPPRLRELGRWLIRSETEGQVPFELTYFTSGLSWRAFYMGTLSQDEKTMRLESYVRVQNNSGEDYEDARTRLIVGQVHLLDEIAQLAQRQYAYDRPMHGRRGGMGGGMMGGMGPADENVLFQNGKKVYGVFYLADSDRLRKEVRKEGLSEYFLYTIGGTETIPNEWGKRLLSFEANDIPVKNLYKYDEERWGNQTIRFLSFANDEEHKLGETPLPDGAVRVYGVADKQGHLSYAGGMGVKYIPVGEEVELDLGPARLVEVKPVLMDYRTENHTFDRDGDISGWDEVRTWRIDVVNADRLPIEVEVTRGFETAYWTLKPAVGDASYEKHDVTHARFRLNVEPRSKRAFEYTVTTYHGVREEILSDR